MRKQVVLLWLLACMAVSSSAQSPKTRLAIPISRGYFAALHSAPVHTASNQLSPATNAAAQAQSPKIVSLPTFSGSFHFAGKTFAYTMVGHAPAEHMAAVISTAYVPLSFFFDEFLDLNGNNVVIDATAITGEIKESPLFEKSQYATGSTQFVDAQMRAEFFPFVNKDLDDFSSHDFHVLLDEPRTLIPVTIEVPAGSAVVFSLADGTFAAIIDINFLNSQLNTLVQTEPLSVNSIPIFLTRNAVYSDFQNQQPIDCCIGGFHTAFETRQTATQTFVQTLAFATSLDGEVADSIFGDPGLFADVNALSHELGELLNNPFVDNVTPSYQIPGAPAGTCQNSLEVGDVVENLSPDYTAVTLHGFTYHPQTLGLLQWFEGKKPSTAIHGDYSFPDSSRLTSPFTPCPSGS